MNWNRLNIRAKLTLIFGTLAFISLMAAALTFVSFNQINGIRAIILDIHMADKSRLITNNRFLSYLHNPSDNNSSELLSSLEDMKAILNDLKADPLHDDHVNMISGILNESDNYKELLQILFEKNKQNDFQLNVSSTGTDTENTRTSEDIDEILKNINISDNSIEDGLNDLLDGSMHIFNIQRSRNIIFILTFLAVIITGATIVSIFYSRNLSRRINRAVGFATLIASGDITVRLEDKLLKENDEIGKLARNLNDMGDSLEQISTSISDVSKNISEASIQFTDTSRLLSRGANIQASSSEEISTTMTQIAANIDQNSKNSSLAEKIAEETEAGVLDGVQAASSALEFIDLINEKINVIKDITFQTNILALNAAVEASRAGEHGRGFAVVASEVRKLAENSEKSAKDIENMAEKLKEASAAASTKLNAVIPKVKDNLNIIKEISAAGKEQSAGAEQITSAINELNTVVQQNAEASEKLSANAEEVRNQSDNLLESLSFFKISGSNKRIVNSLKQVTQLKPVNNLLEYTQT